MNKFLAFFFLALVAVSASAKHIKFGKVTKHGEIVGTTYPSFLQCDSRWGSDRLGTSTNTICSAGCAMTSVTMALAGHGTSVTPASLNSWLISHGGYSSGDLINWASVDAFGTVSYVGQYAAGVLTIADLENGLSEGHSFIANVRSGTHWVLLTGYNGNGEFAVHDPAAFATAYAYSGMSHISAYKPA